MEVVKYIISNILVLCMHLLYIKIIVNPKLRENKKHIIISMAITMILYIIFFMYLEGIIKSVAGLFATIIAAYYLYDQKIGKTILLVILCLITLMMTEVLMFIIINIFNISKDYVYNNFAGSLTANCVVFILSIPIMILTKIILKKIIDKKTTINKKIAIFSILTFISTLVFFNDITVSFRAGAKIIFYIIAIITFAIALIIVINQENKNAKLRLEYNKLLEFMETYEVELENQRIIKHEYKNQLITIKSKLIDNDKKNKVIDYIDSILGDNTKFSQESYTKLQYLPANGIKALFYFKISEAHNKGIKTSVNISPNIKMSKLKDLTTKEFKELGILIGVYLDNAIEASIESKKKLLGIEMYNNKEYITIIISNSYKEIVELNKLGKINFSTKGKGRGYGLMLVNNTLRHNKKFNSEREITPNLYIQSIKIVCK